MTEKTRQRKYHEKMLSCGLKYIHIYVPEDLVEVYKKGARLDVKKHMNKQEKVNG